MASLTMVIFDSNQIYHLVYFFQREIMTTVCGDVMFKQYMHNIPTCHPGQLGGQTALSQCHPGQLGGAAKTALIQ